MQKPAEALNGAGVSLWVDNITRDMLDRGQLEKYRDELKLSGLTSNPTIFNKAIDAGNSYDASIRSAGSTDPEQVFFSLAIEDLRRAAKIFEPVHRRASGVDGWVSLEVSPLLADDAAKTIEQAVQLHRQAKVENLFIKVPGTPAGVGAIEELIYRGVPINVTLLFSPAQYLASAQAYLRGLDRRLSEGLPLNVASVASIFVSRWDAKVADRVPAELRNHLGLAVSRRVYAEYRKMLESAPMQRLMNNGARPQRLLWASTGTKDPAASDVLYVENLIAPLTVNTMPENTLKAFADHGKIQPILSADVGAADDGLHLFAQHGIEVDAVAAVLQKEGKESFNDSWNALLPAIRKRMEAKA